MHQAIADATFRVEAGPSSGTGFSFRHERIVITNAHVVAPHFSTGVPINVVDEHGSKIGARVVAHSPPDQLDFALLELAGEMPAGRRLLEPDVAASTPRGTRVIFAGFPHGIHDLLVHEAIVSGPAAPRGFYIDGSVNGGNSGGPIVSCESGRVIGIVTKRRFLGALQLDQLRQNASGLAQHCSSVAGQGSVVLMGVNFGQFAQVMSQGFLIMDEILKSNANSGIGIGFSIQHANAEYEKLGLP